MDLLQLPMEALTWFKATTTKTEANELQIKSISRDYSLQFLCNRLDSSMADAIETVFETYDRVRDIKQTGSVQNRETTNADETTKSAKGGKRKKSESKGGGKDAKQKDKQQKGEKGAKRASGAADSKNKKDTAKAGKGGGKNNRKRKSALYVDEEPVEPRTDCYLINKNKVHCTAKICSDCRFFNINVQILFSNCSFVVFSRADVLCGRSAQRVHIARLPLAKKNRG